MKKRKKVDWRIVIAAITSLTLLEGLAILNGIDGVLLTAVIAIIAGLAGWSLPQLRTS